MLKRKMYRDMKKNLSQFITIFLMIMIGVMAYTGIEAYMDGMKITADKFYTNYNLFDLQIIGNQFTKDDLKKIKQIENVQDAEGKLSVTAKTDKNKTLLLNFIESNNISKFYIADGEKFDSSKSGVWLDEFYAKKNNIQIGDIITIRYDTLVLKEKVIALINVPDHLYDTKDQSELYPNREEFGFAYLSINEIPEDYIKEQIMKELNTSDMENFNYKDYVFFNYIMVDVNDLTKRENVKNEIEDALTNVLAITNKEDTTSYSMYQGEIDEGKTYVGVFSGLFIFIAMLSVITTMTRVIKNERIQIGTLKALGFSDLKILIHYMNYGLIVSIVGVILGLLVGYYGIGKFFISMEMSFFEIPNGFPYMNTSSYIVGLLVILCVILITYITGRGILKENASETLRKEIPSVKKGTLNLSRKGFFKKLNFSSKWNLRDILRNRVRTIMGITGVTGCCMLIVCALGMLDSLNHFIHLQFEDLYHFDYKLTLKNDLTEEELNQLENKYGTSTSQTLGIEIKNKNERISNNAVVTAASNKLRFVDKNDQFITIDSKDGIYVTYKLAQKYGYQLGDVVTWRIYGRDIYYKSKIIGFNKDPQNQNITMTKEYLEKLGIVYQPDSLYTNRDLSDITEIQGVSLIQNISTLKNSMSNMLSTMKSMIVLIIGIAILLGAIIIYNLGILSYTEKQYQFATLKVLGFDDKKIKKVFIKQNNWIAIISILIGLPLGYYLTNYLFKVAIDEHYDFSAYIRPTTYMMAALGTFMVSYIVSRFLSKKINQIDMVSSLKGNE